MLHRVKIYKMQPLSGVYLALARVAAHGELWLIREQ